MATDAFTRGYQIGFQRPAGGKSPAGIGTGIGRGLLEGTQEAFEEKRKEKEKAEEKLEKEEIAEKEFQRKLKLEELKQKNKETAERLKVKSKQEERARFGLDQPTEEQVSQFPPPIREGRPIAEETGEPFFPGPGGGLVSGREAEFLPEAPSPTPGEVTRLVGPQRFEQQEVAPRLKQLETRGLIPEATPTGIKISPKKEPTVPTPKVPSWKQQQDISAVKAGLKRNKIVFQTMMGEPEPFEIKSLDDALDAISRKGLDPSLFAKELDRWTPIMIKDKKGNVFEIPKFQLDDALKQGYTTQ